jgi:hypothetical protein
MKKTIVALIILVMAASVAHAELLEPDGIGVWQLRTDLTSYITYTFFGSNKWVSVDSDTKGTYEYKYGQLAIKQIIAKKYKPKTMIAGTVQFRGNLMIVTGIQEWVFEKAHAVKIKSDELKITSIDPEVVNKNYTKGVTTRNQLQKFLRTYCRTYENKDLTKFTGFFTADAIEKGKSFNSMLPKYRKNFETIDSIVYHIELTKYSWQFDTKTLEIQGKYYVKWLPHGADWKKNSGWISMSLLEHNNSYRIKRLDYNSEISPNNKT